VHARLRGDGAADGQRIGALVRGAGGQQVVHAPRGRRGDRRRARRPRPRFPRDAGREEEGAGALAPRAAFGKVVNANRAEASKLGISSGGRIPMLRKVLVALAASLATAAALAQYPTKPVRVVVTFPPGGTPDIYGRIMSSELSKLW